MKQRRIIDKREKAKFMIDDEFLEKMARLCGWQGTAVYMSLCRHANKEQECFPSLSLMAEQHRISRTTVLKGIKALEARNVISVSKTRSKGGKWLNNTYTLLNKSEWDYYQVYEVETVSSQNDAIAESIPNTLPSPRDISSRVYFADTKDTHGKETHKEGNTVYAKRDVLPGIDIFELVKVPLGGEEENGQEIEDEPVEPKEGVRLNEAISLFQKILPGDFVGSKTAFAKPPTRKAVTALMERYTLESLKALIDKYEARIADPYRPSVGTVYEFCTVKLAKIEAFVAKTPGGLWAHRPVSTPEQSRVRDEQYRVAIEASKKKQKRLMEEWREKHPAEIS